MEAAHESLVEERVFERAQRLLAVQHAVAEMTGGRKVETDPVALKNAVLQIRTAVQSIPGAYCVFIGGLAVQEHGYVRWTDDVDVVVDAEHYREVLEALREQGYMVTPELHLINKETGAHVDFLKEGVTLKNAPAPLPHPSELGRNGGFAKLSALIRMKLDAHRRQDLADVVALMRKNLTKTQTVQDELPENYRAEFLALAEEARQELS